MICKNTDTNKIYMYTAQHTHTHTHKYVLYYYINIVHAESTPYTQIKKKKKHGNPNAPVFIPTLR